jgi:D-alanyl-D-alanine carboxypeptidase
MNKLFYCIFTLVLLFYANNLFALNYTKEQIGLSVNKKPINVYKFGRGKDLIIIIAGLHGNEKNTVESAYSVIEYYDKDPNKIPLNKSLWIIPNANPDGYEKGRRLNENDVDLNRNFETSNWKPKFYLYSDLLSAGDKPFSEPETQNLKVFFESINNKNTIVISLHSRGNSVIPADSSNSNKKLAYFIKNNTNFEYNDINYKATGDLTSWVYEKLNIPSVTIEYKTKDENEFYKILPALEALFRTDFKNTFYIDNSMEISENGYVNKIFNNLVRGLPEKTIELLSSNEEEKKNFLRLYKLIQDDDELLLLVNKSNYLSKDYEPQDLIDVGTILPANKNSIYLRKIILNDLTEMIEKAKSSNIRLVIISGYRSYETQKAVFNGWKAKFGEDEAKRISALPGASQHQLGTTIDFNSLDQSFENTPEGLWLYNNAYKYGFILSYPLGMEALTGYKYEPWHYRYIGKNAAYMVYHYFDNLLEVFLNWYWSKKLDK